MRQIREAREMPAPRPPDLPRWARSVFVGTAWENALDLAWEGFRAGTTPVGAVVVAPDGAVVTAGRGRRYEATAPAGQLADSHIAHAEINALARLGSERHWTDHRLLTTLEPCAMCHGAAVEATIGGIWFAAPDPCAGTAGMQIDTPQSVRRPLRIDGPILGVPGVVSVLLHLVWLIERAGARGARPPRPST
jgi:tRNA(Arg) A34 adenosine deaminase TadA